jgi:hypothetical protein
MEVISVKSPCLGHVTPDIIFFFSQIPFNFYWAYQTKHISITFFIGTRIVLTLEYSNLLLLAAPTLVHLFSSPEPGALDVFQQ